MAKQSRNNIKLFVPALPLAIGEIGIPQYREAATFSLRLSGHLTDFQFFYLMWTGQVSNYKIELSQAIVLNKLTFTIPIVIFIFGFPTFESFELNSIMNTGQPTIADRLSFVGNLAF